MSKKAEKLINKMSNTKAGFTFEDCLLVLKYLGFELHTNDGSHFTFKNEETKQRITIAKHNPMSKNAIKDILSLIKEKGSL